VCDCLLLQSGLYLLSSLLMLWFSLICAGVLSFSVPIAYATSISVGFAMFGTYPLFFELAIETVFPIPEVSLVSFDAFDFDHNDIVVFCLFNFFWNKISIYVLCCR
jgi:hypothetical protein